MSVLRIIITFTASIVFFLSGCENEKTLSSSHNKHKKLRKQVSVSSPERKKLALEIKQGTTLAPSEVSKIIPETGGKFIKYYVKEHDLVKKGQPVALLDSTDHRLRHEQAKMKLASLEAKFASVEKTYNRSRRLLEEEAITRQDFDTIKAEYRALEKQINALENQAKLLERQVKKTIPKAPFSGEITLLPAIRGQLTAAGKTNLAVIKNIKRLKISLNISEKYYNEIEQGMEISFFIPSMNKSVKANIHSKSKSINKMKKFNIIVYIDNKNNEIPAGVRAVAKIKTEKKERIIVPPTAILERETSSEIMTVDENGTVKNIEVVKGFSFEEGVEIFGDIPDLIIRDVSTVTVGEKVEVGITN